MFDEASYRYNQSAFACYVWNVPKKHRTYQRICVSAVLLIITGDNIHNSFTKAARNRQLFRELLMDSVEMAVQA